MEEPSLFVTPQQLEDYTHKVRPSAQAKFLAARGMRFDVRDDGTIALRKEELDRHTLSAGASKTANVRARPVLDLESLRRPSRREK